jgi:hypothetical protein
VFVFTIFWLGAKYFLQKSVDSKSIKTNTLNLNLDLVSLFWEVWKASCNFHFNGFFIHNKWFTGLERPSYFTDHRVVVLIFKYKNALLRFWFINRKNINNFFTIWNRISTITYNLLKFHLKSCHLVKLLFQNNLRTSSSKTLIIGHVLS